jgi:hypothetical protein
MSNGEVQTIITQTLTERQNKQFLHYSLEMWDLARWGKKEITIKCHLLTHMQMKHLFE